MATGPAASCASHRRTSSTFGEAVTTLPWPRHIFAVERTKERERSHGYLHHSRPDTRSRHVTRGNGLYPAAGSTTQRSQSDELHGPFHFGWWWRFEVWPFDERDEFSAADKKLVAYVRWNPNQRLRGTSRLRVWRQDGSLAVDSKPKKIDLKADILVITQWELPVPAPPGPYVVEVLLDDRVMWRKLLGVR